MGLYNEHEEKDWPHRGLDRLNVLRGDIAKVSWSIRE